MAEGRARRIWPLAVLGLIALGAIILDARSDAESERRIASLTAALEASHADSARKAFLESQFDAIDRGFARAANSEDALRAMVAQIPFDASPASAALKDEITKRLDKMRDDLVAPSKAVREIVLQIDPPRFVPDPAKLTPEANAAFLAAIDADPSYTKTPSGLRFRRIKDAAAPGASPAPENEVTVHYEGVFIDGTEFDSSVRRGYPATFQLTRLITGWTEGIPKMREGETFELVLPYSLAYGVAGRGQIPPRQTLIFKVELLKVLPPPPPG